MKFIVYPNPDKKTTHRYDRIITKGTDGGRDISTTENTLTRAPNTRFTFMVPRSKRLGGHLQTGLLEMVPNIYKDLSNYRNPEWESVLKDNDEILLQHLLEYKHYKDFNYYTNVVTSERYFNKSDKVPFYQTADAIWNLSDGANVFDTDNPKDELFYRAALSSNIFANNYRERTFSNLFYIAKEFETDEIKASKSKIKDAAISKLIMIDELEENLLIKFIKALNIKVRNVKKEAAYNILRDYINKNNANIKSFNYVYKLWKDPATKAKFNVLCLVKDYLDARLIVNNGGTKYMWIPPREESGRQPDSVTWNKKEDLINYLLDANNSWAIEEMELQYKFKNRL